jgi:hypothetical protein
MLLLLCVYVVQSSVKKLTVESESLGDRRLRCTSNGGLEDEFVMGE